MKKLFYAIAALAIVASCAKVSEVETNVEPKDEKNLVHMTIRAQAPETKTFIEKTGEKTYQPNWNEGDQLAVFFDEIKATKDAVLDNYGNDGDAAEFMGDVTIPNGEYTVYAFYPATTVFKKGSSNDKVELQVATVQRPAANTFDPSADIAVGKALDINVATNTVTIDDMVFARLLSTVKVTITESNDAIAAGEKINAITIVGESNLTGVIEWDYKTQEATAVSDDNTVTADLSANPIAFGTSTYVLVNPATLANESELSIIVSTDSHEITKTITSLPKDIVFPLGGIAELNINLDNASSVAVNSPISEPTGSGWFLVKKAYWLRPGDEVAIIAQNSDSYYAMSIEQKSSNRGATGVTVSTEKLTINDNVQRFNLEVGNKANTYAFKCINGEKKDNYIYASSNSSNQLKSKALKEDDGSFSISIEDGTATLIAQRTGRNDMRFNYNNGSPLFACYASTSELPKVLIFKHYDLPKLDTPTNLEAVAVGDDVSVSWNAVAGADSYTVSCGANVQESITDTNYTFENLEDGVYSVSVIAVSNNPSAIANSDAANTTVTVGTPTLGKPVISSFTQSPTGFNAVISAAVPYATSYDWDLFEGNMDTLVGSGNTTNLSFEVLFTSADVDIDAFTIGTTYYLVVTAKATGFSSTASDAASFVATPDTHYYVKVTSTAGITSGDSYIIVANKNCALVPSATANDMKKPAKADVTVTNNKIESNATTDAYAVKLTNTANGYTISYIISGTTYYLWYNSSTNFQATTTAPTKWFTISAADNYGTFVFADTSTADASTKRGLIFRAGDYNIFGAYSLNNPNGTEYFNLDLYKYE